MENNVNPAAGQPTPAPAAPQKKKGKGARRFFTVLLLAAAGYGAWTLYDLYLTPDRNIRQIYLVPPDAAVIIQTSDPVADWKKLSASPPWQALRKAPAFAEIGGAIDGLDSLIKANNTLFSAVGRRDVLISLHKTRSAGWDFLAVVDLQKAAKMNTVKDNVEQFFKISCFTVTNRRYKGTNITESRDPKTYETLYSAFADNHFIASYNTRLVEAALDERENPTIGLKDSFLEIERAVAGKGLARLYINYEYLPGYLSVYMGRNEWVDLLCKSMDFGGMYMLAERDRFEIAGPTVLREEPDPYVAALLASGAHRMAAHELMPSRTALYVNLGFENSGKFVSELERALSVHDPASFKTYQSSRSKLEKYLGISLQENFLDWMDGEFALAQTEPGLLGREPEQLLAVRAKSIKKARDGLDLIEKHVTKRTPINIKTIKYKDYEVKYIELSGFFRLFFGKLFDKFEKPYYTYVGDYVVFSNKATSLLSFLEDYEQKNLMQGEAGFLKAYGQVASTSTIFTYVDMPRFFPQLRPLLSPETRASLDSHKDVLFNFPQWTLQIVAGRGNATVQMVVNYSPWVEPAVAVEAEVAGDSTAVEDQSEKEIMNELKRFYVENFEGNVLREYYPGGELLSESEVKAGRREGRYREFYENGKLKARGDYKANKPHGTWKYYTPEGKLDHKERF